MRWKIKKVLPPQKAQKSRDGSTEYAHENKKIYSQYPSTYHPIQKINSLDSSLSELDEQNLDLTIKSHSRTKVTFR